MSFTEGGRSLPEAAIRAVINAVQSIHGSSLPPETVAEDEKAIREIVAPLRKGGPPADQEKKEKQRASFLAKGSGFRRKTEFYQKGKPKGTTQIIPSSQE